MSRLRHGIDPVLEEEADALIKASFQDNPDPQAKGLILTKYMMQSRVRREVYTAEGTPDGAVRRGSFGRAINRAYPHLNATEGVARPARRIPLRTADE
ncbi:DUF7236 family protein [Streptomyces albidoflavus]|uniref:DUF7236 family protein n=1 Tax=Streptomyces albidoflavus TaxID=1886 RepID=UPI0033C3478E